MTTPGDLYEIVRGDKVETFLSRHPELKNRWERLEVTMSQSPRHQGQSSHLKGNLH